ncbi:MAG: hypothetical protein V8Q30_09795 [Acutalibacteraceae bacterium]
MNKKKLLALVLAALMSVSTTVVAFADDRALRQQLRMLVCLHWLKELTSQS